MVDFTPDNILHLDNILYEDVTFLQDLCLMDYSLLLIILKLPNENENHDEDIIKILRDSCYRQRIFKSQNLKYIYCLGIIDYLQKFNMAKFFENKYKSIVYGNEIKYVSAVDPMIYGNRLLDFCSEYVFVSK
jgi:hypothetical protein